MKIYFTAAVLNKPQYGGYYERIVKKLESMGYEVYSDHILKYDVNAIVNQPKEELASFYSEMTKMVSSSDIVVAEVSFPSTVNVGHEMSIGIDKGKPVLALSLVGKKPVLFWGMESEKFYSIEYTDRDLEGMVEMSIEALKDQQDTRFNFFISPKHQHYLDWVAKHRKIPRAVFLRNLIDEEMYQDKGYME